MSENSIYLAPRKEVETALAKNAREVKGLKLLVKLLESREGDPNEWEEDRVDLYLNGLHTDTVVHAIESLRRERSHLNSILAIYDKMDEETSRPLLKGLPDDDGHVRLGGLPKD